MNDTPAGVPAPPEWYVRPYKEGDEHDLLSLYERTFGRPRALEHWRWKLTGRDAPFNLVWVAALPGSHEGQGEQIVGQYGGIPLKIKLGGRTHEGVHAVEAMTDRRFRRQGMLTHLGSAAHATWAAAGQALVTGLPNDQWGTRNRVLGYRPLFPLAWLRFPLHVDDALARRQSVPAAVRSFAYLPLRAASGLWRARSRLTSRLRFKAAGVDIETPDLSMEVSDEIWTNASESWTNLIVRDREWVRWRFLMAEPSPYIVKVVRNGATPTGYVAYRLVERGERRNGYIADLFFVPGDAASATALVDAALDDLSAQGAGTVMTLAAPGSYLYGLLRQLGFLSTPDSTAFSFEIVPLSDAISVDSLADPRQWHLTGGDFDVI